MRITIRIVLALAMGLFATHLLAQDRVYKWTNKDGVTQYTQTPPDSGNYEDVRIGSSGQQRSADQAPDAAREPADAGDGSAIATAADLERQEYCALAQRNLATLSSEAPVHFETEGDEPTAPMDDAERAEQVAIAQRQVALFCLD